MSQQWGTSRGRAGGPRRAAQVVVAASAVVIVGAAVAAALIITGRQRASAERQSALDLARTPRAVTVAVGAAGLDDGGSAIPVSVSGTSALGEPVSQTCYVGADGGGVAVAAGTYDLVVSASPIAADGTLYQVPANPLPLVVPEAAEPGAPLDLSGDVAISLEPIEAADVTDQQLQQALAAARAGGCPSQERARELYETAVARRDQAVRERDRAAAAARYHIVASSYEFDVPEYWWGRVDVRQDGDEVVVYAAGHPEQELCLLTIDNCDTAVSGDIGNGAIWQWQLDDTRVLQLWTIRWSMMATMAASGEAPSEPLTRAEAENLVDLSTGGTVTLDEMVALASERGWDATALPAMEWASDTLVPLVSPHTSDPGRSATG